MSLFDEGASAASMSAPLAVRMRPSSIGEVVGQQQALGEGSALRGLLTGATGVSVILWGPPGTGKTTIASLVSSVTGRDFVELSAVTAGVKDVRAIIDHARDQLSVVGRGTVLFVDEVHRFSKSQQDALLPAVENGWVTLIAATTENPSFSVISPLLSRSVLVTLQPLRESDIAELVRRAVVDPRGLDSRITVTDEAVEYLARLSNGDARRALTSLEAASSGTGDVVDLPQIEAAVQQVAVR